MNVLKWEKKLAVLNALVEGCSIRSTERMCEVHRDTIMRLVVDVGEACRELMSRTMRGLVCRAIEVDEIWTFVKRKQRWVEPGDADAAVVGDQWTFVALDADTRLIPTFAVGKRTEATTKRFITDLRARLYGKPQLTSDGFVAYVDAVDEAFGREVHFAQLVKQYSTPVDEEGNRMGRKRYTGAIKTVFEGCPKQASISTSYVERQNLTIRTMVKRFTRRTNAFSKKLRNLKAALALHFAYYNFCRIHRTLRVTPAMEAGISDHVWELDELLGCTA